MLPEVVATDCDGTLLRSDGDVSAATREVLAAVAAAGTTVLLVTARPPRWMDELAHIVGGLGVALCGNGAFVYDLANSAVVSHTLMEPAVMVEVAADLHAAYPEVSLAAESLRGFAREPGFMRDSGRRDGEWCVGDTTQFLTEPAGKMLVKHPYLDEDTLCRDVSRIVGDRAEVSHSGAAGLAEICPAGVTKGRALARWCAARGVSARHVWAFGDMPNDVPMLSWAGRSFAVANAHAEVVAVATDRAAANDDDGVARALHNALRGPAPYPDLQVR
jgi:Cof subfamily protein (haloacid dehalogenase superfamily)